MNKQDMLEVQQLQDSIQDLYYEVWFDWFFAKLLQAVKQPGKGNNMTETDKIMQELREKLSKAEKENRKLKAQVKPFVPVIYISGPMKDKENFNRDAFNTAAREMREQGYIVMNPAILPDGLSDDGYLNINMAMLRECNAIHMLEGWEDSDGAFLEYLFAKRSGYKRVYRDRDGKYSIFDLETEKVLK